MSFSEIGTWFIEFGIELLVNIGLIIGVSFGITIVWSIWKAITLFQMLHKAGVKPSDLSEENLQELIHLHANKNLSVEELNAYDVKRSIVPAVVIHKCYGQDRFVIIVEINDNEVSIAASEEEFNRYNIGDSIQLQRTSFSNCNTMSENTKSDEYMIITKEMCDGDALVLSTEEEVDTNEC